MIEATPYGAPPWAALSQMFTNLLPPKNMLEWLDKAEASAADAFDQAVEDEATLKMLAQGWRAYLAGKAAAPPTHRDQSNLVANSFPRGGKGAAESGLGTDYPSGLLASLITGWSVATRGLAWQNLMFPAGAAKSTELAELASLLERAPAPKLAPTPAKTQYESKHARVRRIDVDGAEGEPIVLVASLINRWYILDFLPGQSFLARLAELGRPLYLVEWLPPQGADETSLQEFVSGAVQGAVEYARKRHKSEKVALAGYCMGGTLAAAFAARYPERVSRLMTICGPIDFDKGGAFSRWLGAELLDVSLVSSAFDTVPAELVHLPFWWLRPTIKWQKATRLARSFKKPGYVDRFLAAEVWNHDNVDMARGVFRSWAGDLYQRNALLSGTFHVDSEAVDLAKIDVPTLIITGAFDAITPPEGAEALAESVSSSTTTILRQKGSHTGVLTHPKLLNESALAIAAWLDADPQPNDAAADAAGGAN